MPETPQTDCPFCAIASGEDDSVERIAERERWVAFFPSSPATPGHTLVIPREHVANLWTAEPELVGELTVAAVEIGRTLERALAPEGMNLITSKGEAAEQTIFHLHLHLVPRWSDDALDIWPPKKATPRETRESLGDEIRDQLEGRHNA